MSKKDGLPANRALTRSEHAVAPRDTELLEGCFSPKVIKALRNYEKSFEEQAQESEEPEEPAPAYFSLETLKYAQFLVQSNVKLGDWIEFCCKSFTLFWGEKATKMSKLTETKKEEAFDDLRSWISREKPLLHNAYHWPQVICNFFEFCNGLPSEKALSQNPADDEKARSLQSQIFKPESLKNIQFLQQREIRLDLWIALCYKAFLCFWPKGKQTKLPDKVKKQRGNVIKSWCRKEGKFYPLKRTYLDEVLFSFLFDNNKGGRLRNDVLKQ